MAFCSICALLPLSVGLQEDSDYWCPAARNALGNLYDDSKLVLGNVKNSSYGFSQGSPSALDFLLWYIVRCRDGSRTISATWHGPVGVLEHCQSYRNTSDSHPRFLGSFPTQTLSESINAGQYLYYGSLQKFSALPPATFDCSVRKLLGAVAVVLRPSEPVTTVQNPGGYGR